MLGIFKIGEPTNKEIDLNCSVNPEEKGILNTQPGVAIKLDEKGNPAFVQTAISERGIIKMEIDTVSLPKGCDDCLNCVQLSCKEILLTKK